MTLDGIARVAVLGAGNMGHGITEVVALAGYQVTMRDIEADIVQEGYEEIEWSLEKLAEKDRIGEAAADVLGRIETKTDLETAVGDADLVIEAAPEQMDLKQEIFADLDENAPEDAILATNTSSLSISEIASATDHPEQVVGTHFFNPPVQMDLVEVIYGEHTSDETAETAYAFVESIDKTPIYVRKDVHGFVVNTVLAPFDEESVWMVSEGDAEICEVDATMVHERGYPMGPFELVDMTGIDVSYHVREQADIPIPPLMEEKVEASELGRKTGKGYYDYEDGVGVDYTADDVSEDLDWLRIEARTINEAAKLIGDDVATADAIDTGMRLGTGFPEGPCRRADKLGLDTVLDKLESLHEEYGEDRFEPAAYLVDIVEAGKTGQGAGEGFYTYDGGDGLRDYHTINYELQDSGLLEVELDRPERLNALNEDLRQELALLLTSVDVDDVRCVTIEGTGDRAFSAGADIGDFSEMEPYEIEPADVYDIVDGYPRPVIAKIDGFCLGGGHELALACDMRIATEGSEFGFPEINLGILPGGGGTQRTVRMLGDARGKELVLRGNRISAERAEEWGLINRAVPDDEFEEIVQEFVDDFVTGAPVAMEKAKQVMNKGADEPLDVGLEMEIQAFSLLLTTEDANEGIQAFMEDRAPEFTGN
jgi:enoyl-CoA hydratase/3-hydroxyacyl-CoA dehydrogenase